MTEPKDKQPLFGLCPKCNRPLIYNRDNDQIVCEDIHCDFSREYTTKDREAVDGASEIYFRQMLKWDAIYGETPSSLDDQRKVRNIFDKITH